MFYLRRHVKCDETRPACLNCLKWRGYCDAYTDLATAPSHTRASSSSHTVAAINDAQLIHTKKAPLLITEPDVNSIRFTSSEQKAYFDEWIRLSVSFLGGGLNQTRLWTATMPQVTVEEDTLRYGAMAVGALRKAYMYEAAGGSGSGIRMQLEIENNRHYLNAVIYYCEALRLQSQAEPTREGLRTALLSSLLFICFEAQRGNLPAALKHISYGFSMLNELAMCTDLAPGLVSIAQAPPSLVQEILDCYKPLELQSRSFLGSYNRFLYSPRPDSSGPRVPSGLSTEVTATPDSASTACFFTVTSDGGGGGGGGGGLGRPEAWTASDIAAPVSGMTTLPNQPITPRAWQSPTTMTVTATATRRLHDMGLPSPQIQSSNSATPPPRPPPPQHHLTPQTPAYRFSSIAPFTKNSPYFRPRQPNITTLDLLPPKFHTLEQAQGYWILVQKVMVSHLPVLTMVTSKLGLSRVAEAKAEAEAEAELETKLSSVKQNPSIRNFINEMRHWLSRWSQAFEPVYKSLCGDGIANPLSYLHVINLRLEYLMLIIYTTVPRFSDLPTAKSLTPQYDELNRHAETLLRARPNCGFAMDSGWTWPLFISSFSCRDPNVRQDAIRILGQYPIRNVLRDSLIFRAIALRNQQAEEHVMRHQATEHDGWLQLRRRELVFEDSGASIIFRSAERNRRTGQWELIEEIAGSAVLSDGRLDWRRRPISESASILSGVC